MKCNYCGKELNDNAQFCTSCGHSTENIDNQSNSSQKPKKGAYFFSIISLIIILALMGMGGFQILYRDLHPEKFGSAAGSTSASDIENIDSQLIGTWLCTDPVAADYDETDYGIKIKATLILTVDGAFTLNYELINTGLKVKSFTILGGYSTEDGMITFSPYLSDNIKHYIERHGEKPSFQYSADEDIFTLTYENGKEIIFTSSNS